MRLILFARMTAAFVRTGILLMALVGSGITGGQPSGGDVAIALLANTLASTYVCGAHCGWGVHHVGVPVHGIDVVRQSRGDTGKGRQAAPSAA